MKIAAEIEWKTDGFGREHRALYLGGLCVGHIMELASYKDYGFAGPFRGWFMNDDDGSETGYFMTEEDARASVELKLFEAIQIQRADGE